MIKHAQLNVGVPTPPAGSSPPTDSSVGGEASALSLHDRLTGRAWDRLLGMAALLAGGTAAIRTFVNLNQAEPLDAKPHAPALIRKLVIPLPYVTPPAPPKNQTWTASFWRLFNKQRQKRAYRLRGRDINPADSMRRLNAGPPLSRSIGSAAGISPMQANIIKNLAATRKAVSAQQAKPPEPRYVPGQANYVTSDYSGYGGDINETLPPGLTAADYVRNPGLGIPPRASQLAAQARIHGDLAAMQAQRGIYAADRTAARLSQTAPPPPVVRRALPRKPLVPSHPAATARPSLWSSVNSLPPPPPPPPPRPAAKPLPNLPDNVFAPPPPAAKAQRRANFQQTPHLILPPVPGPQLNTDNQLLTNTINTAQPFNSYYPQLKTADDATNAIEPSALAKTITDIQNKITPPGSFLNPTGAAYWEDMRWPWLIGPPILAGSVVAGIQIPNLFFKKLRKRELKDELAAARKRYMKALQTRPLVKTNNAADATLDSIYDNFEKCAGLPASPLEMYYALLLAGFSSLLFGSGIYTFNQYMKTRPQKVLQAAVRKKQQQLVENLSLPLSIEPVEVKMSPEEKNKFFNSAQNNKNNLSSRVMTGGLE